MPMQLRCLRMLTPDLATPLALDQRALRFPIKVLFIQVNLMQNTAAI